MFTLSTRMQERQRGNGGQGEQRGGGGRGEREEKEGVVVVVTFSSRMYLGTL